MRQTDVWQDGYKLRYDKNITLCSAPARTQHMNNTNAHTTINSPSGIAGARSSTISV